MTVFLRNTFVRRAMTARQRLASLEITLPDCQRTVGITARAITTCGAKRDRTANLLVANQALSQLSYSPATRQLQSRSPENEWA